MPKETLSLLDRDTERLLFAGAQLARSDGDVEARKQKLAPLGPKAPAIAKVVEQVEKVQKASGKAAAAELLSLSALMAQVRGAQAAPAAAVGELTPLAASEPVESPLSPTELLSLVNALTVSGKARPRIVADAVERGAVRDLRLLPYCVSALSDPAVGHVVERQLLPKLGHLVVPELKATLRVANGKELDAKKLRVLVAIVGDEIKPLLVEATAAGSPEMRRTGIEKLGELDVAAAEPIALRLLGSDKSMEVRKAAVKALAGGTREETMDALFKAFAEVRDLRHNAGYALSKLANPRTTERALALLTPELRGLTNLKLPKADTKPKKEANAKLEKEHREKVWFLSAVLDLLASRTDRLQTAETVLGVFHDHKVKDVKNAAALALLKSGFAKAFDELAPSVYEADWETQDGFIEGILTSDPDHAFDRLGRFLDASTFKGKNHVAFAERVLGAIEGNAGSGSNEEPTGDEEEEGDDGPPEPSLGLLEKEPRWVDAAIKLLDHKDLGGPALELLGQARSDKAKEAVIAVAAAHRKKDEAWRVLRVLATVKDPRVPPLMIGFLDMMQGWWARRFVFRTLREHDDPAAAVALRAWSAGKKKLDERDKAEVETTLQLLERDRVLAAKV